VAEEAQAQGGGGKYGAGGELAEVFFTASDGVAGLFEDGAADIGDGLSGITLFHWFILYRFICRLILNRQFLLRKRCDNVNNSTYLPYRVVITPDFTSGACANVVCQQEVVRGRQGGCLAKMYRLCGLGGANH